MTRANACSLGRSSGHSRAAKDRNRTPELAEWANQIKFRCNDANHGEEPSTEEDARQIGEFTELFLTYMFTLPEKFTGAGGKRERDRK